MTALAKRKTKLQFETSASVQGRTLIVEAGTRFATIRRKGTRNSYSVSWESIFLRGAIIEADRQRREREARRNRKR